MNKLFKRTLRYNGVIGRLVTTPAFLMWVEIRNIRVWYMSA
jgi:hypothetical protein